MRLTILAVCFGVLGAPSLGLADQIPSGTICDREPDTGLRSCYRYCEVLDCDSDPSADPKKCAKALKKFTKKTGLPRMLCDRVVDCPCHEDPRYTAAIDGEPFDRCDIWSRENTWNAEDVRLCYAHPTRNCDTEQAHVFASGLSLAEGAANAPICKVARLLPKVTQTLPEDSFTLGQLHFCRVEMGDTVAALGLTCNQVMRP